jgi:hypothetical protein
MNVLKSQIQLVRQTLKKWTLEVSDKQGHNGSLFPFYVTRSMGSDRNFHSLESTASFNQIL